MVDRAQLGEPGNIVIEDDRALARLTEWTKAAHDGGAAIFAQLNHPGRQSNLLAVGHEPVAPSPVPLAMAGAATPRELTATEIEDIIDRFATAAAVCEEAGFDGRAARCPRLPRHPVPLAADEPSRRRMGRHPRATDAVPDRGRPASPAAGEPGLRRGREAELGRLPARRLHRAGLASRGGRSGRRGRGPDRGLRWQLRVTGDGRVRSALHQGAGGLLPGLRPVSTMRGRLRPDRGDRWFSLPFGDGRRVEGRGLRSHWHRSADGHRYRCSGDSPRRTHDNAGDPRDPGRDAQVPRPAHRSEGARRVLEHQLECRPAAPAGPRTRAEPEPRCAGDRAGDGRRNGRVSFSPKRGLS